MQVLFVHGMGRSPISGRLLMHEHRKKIRAHNSFRFFLGSKLAIST